jgi:hypothetical protein
LRHVKDLISATVSAPGSILRMSKIRAEHATAGKYHLETNYDRENGRWEWWAKGIKPNNVPESTDIATTLTAAKKDACSRTFREIRLAIRDASISLKKMIDWISHAGGTSPKEIAMKARVRDG